MQIARAQLTQSIRPICGTYATHIQYKKSVSIAQNNLHIRTFNFVLAHRLQQRRMTVRQIDIERDREGQNMRARDQL